jgi:hypothetical protein
VVFCCNANMDHWWGWGGGVGRGGEGGGAFETEGSLIGRGIRSRFLPFGA